MGRLCKGAWRLATGLQTCRCLPFAIEKRALKRGTNQPIPLKPQEEQDPPISELTFIERIQRPLAPPYPSSFWNCPTAHSGTFVNQPSLR